MPTSSLGPTENTLDTFWKMIWENHVQTIVMLTKCVEGGKVCCRRWSQGGSKYGERSVGGWLEQVMMRIICVCVCGGGGL